MANTSTKGSPGVEVREFDESTRIVTSTATTIFVPGYAAQGPVEEVMTVSSVEDFINIYGEPSNAAERYFFYTVKSLLDNSGGGTTVLTSRLPYGAGKGDNVSTAFTMLAYPAVPVVRNPKASKGYDYYELETTSRGTKLDTELAKLFTLKLVGNPEGAESPAAEIKPTSVKFDIAGSFKDAEEVQKSIIHAITKDEGIYSLHYTFELESAKVNAKLKWSKQPNAVAHETTLNLVAVLDDQNGNTEGNHIATISFEAVYDDINLWKFDGLYDFAPVSAQDNDAAPMTTSLKPVFTKAFMKAATYDGQVFSTYAEQRGIDYDKTLFVQKNSTYNETESNQQMLFAKDVTYMVGAPVTFQVSLDEYYSIISGQKFKWQNTCHRFKDYAEQGVTTDFDKYEAIQHSAFIMLNTARSTVNDKFEGYYLGMSDNMFISPSDDYVYDAVKNVKVTTDTMASLGNSLSIDKPYHKGLIDNAEGTADFDILSTARLGFPTDGNNSGSMSKYLERGCTNMDISTSEYDDTLSICLFKLNKSTTDAQTLRLAYTLREKYNAAFGKTRLKSTSTATTPVTYFVENIIADSNNMTVMVNPYIAKTIGVDVDGVLRGKVRILGDKLSVNLDNYEQQYTVKNLAKKLDNNKIDPISLAKNYLDSYAKLIAQAGVSPSFIQEFTSDDENELFQPCDSVYPLGTYTTLTNTTKIIGNVPYKLERALELVENDEEYPDCDIVVDGGLTTIYAYSNGGEVIGDSTDLVTALDEEFGDNTLTEESDATLNKQTQFNDQIILRGIEDMRTGRASLSEHAEAVIEDWKAVENTFLKFCNSQTNGGRGDCFFIGDVLRGILVKGKNTKVESLYGTRLLNSSYGDSEEVNNSWSTSVYYPIKHLTSDVATSYAGLYAQWFKIDDVYSGDKTWVPASGYMAALMAATDQLYGPWYAAAGHNRGIVQGVLDCALNPKDSQQTDLYKLCINSVPKKAQGGIMAYGIRTMSKKDSAFDQIPCRRTFLYMEKYLKRFLKYFVFEPNTSYTRLAMYNEIEPFLTSLVTQGAIYSFSLVIDKTNNTPEIINNGDSAVDVIAAPTRTAENIILNARASKYTGTASVTSNMS